jgi:predicted N-formylglutamate amidohydrolase
MWISAGKMAPFQLLSAGENPVAVESADAQGDVLLVCEHASRLMPDSLGTLGLDQKALDSHIAWDPGALDLSRRLSTELDAVLYHQRFSRLVYDCNRPHDAPSAIVTTSESYAVPGNRDISPEERSARINEIYVPFREGLASLIGQRTAAGRSTVLVTIHSFTRVYFDRLRDVEVGILHARDSRMADEIMRETEQLPPKYIVRRNEPYGPADGVMHTLVEHGIKNSLPNVMIEVRNDLLRNDDDQMSMAAFLAPLINKAVSTLRQQSGDAAAQRPNN